MPATSGTLAQALVAFHKDAPKISLDATNPHFKSKFASLPGIMDTVRKPLADVGLVVLQHPCVLDSGMPGLRTTLLHSSGEREEDVMALAVDKPGPQAQGAALTYARRYAVLSILGLVGDEDDDANSAEQPKSAKPEPKPFAAPVTTPDKEADMLAGQLVDLAEKLGAAADTRKRITANLSTHNLKDHKAWLKRQIATAEQSLLNLAEARA